MRILGIESSCDETAAAVLDSRGNVLSSIVASQVASHAPYGGVVPEIAARHHLEAIEIVVEQALREARLALEHIDGIAVTRGPGLVGCLLVGVSYARGLAWRLGVPVVGVNHLAGHIASGWIDRPRLPYPALALVVSGGHTAIWRVPEADTFIQLARTRDDAAGEAFDKVAKMLGLAYPGGPVIDRLAPQGNPQGFTFGAVRIKGPPAFSFSGYKTAVRTHMRKSGIAPLADAEEKPPQQMLDLIASFRYSVVRELIRRTREAMDGDRPRSLVLAGGVAANRLLRGEITQLADAYGVALSIPAFRYCADNAAMIALAGRERLLEGEDDIDRLDAAAGLPLGVGANTQPSRRHR